MQTNPSRIYALDVARGFTVFFIPAIHCWILYAGDDQLPSIIGSLFRFIAEWPGAQLFMVHMGIGFSFSSGKAFKAVLIRSSSILLLAYLLNAAKFLVPYFSGYLPAQLMHDINASDPLSLMLVGDILHFAALALPVLWLVKKLPQYAIFAIILLFSAAFAAQYLWYSVSSFGNPFADHLVHLFIGEPPQAFFPFFPWIVYPLTGLAIGKLLQYHKNPFYFSLLISGFVFMIIGYSLEPNKDQSFYRTTGWLTMHHVGFVCYWIAIWYLSVKQDRLEFVFKPFEFLGRHITIFYLIQWPLIFWLLPFVGYRQNNTIETLAYTYIITIASIRLTKLYIKYFK